MELNWARYCIFLGGWQWKKEQILSKLPLSSGWKWIMVGHQSRFKNNIILTPDNQKKKNPRHFLIFSWHFLACLCMSLHFLTFPGISLHFLGISFAFPFNFLIFPDIGSSDPPPHWAATYSYDISTYISLYIFPHRYCHVDTWADMIFPGDFLFSYRSTPFTSCCKMSRGGFPSLQSSSSASSSP